jgi:chromosome segregation ATPase
MTSEITSPPDDLAELRLENEELRRRVDSAEGALAELRAEAIARRAEVRALAEELPTALSRRALLTAMLRDARRHPDKRGVMRRALAKALRAPRKAARVLTGRS